MGKCMIINYLLIYFKEIPDYDKKEKIIFLHLCSFLIKVMGM